MPDPDDVVRIPCPECEAEDALTESHGLLYCRACGHIFATSDELDAFEASLAEQSS